MNILIGDDHLLFREGLRRLLEQFSPAADFAEAASFDEVRDLCSERDDLDLVLIDLQMPGWPGFEGIRQLKSQVAGTPVVVVSASESRSDVRNAIDNGAAGFIPKSSSVKVMMSAIDLVFSGGIYVPPAALAPGGDPEPSEAPAGPRGGSRLLTQRQYDVLRCLREGKSNKQIAYELGLSEGTVKIHVTAIFKSLGVRNRTQAVIAAADAVL